MKAYVLPVESACNGRCRFCITRFRRTEGEFLTAEVLRRALGGLHLERIEITGGGEPLLNPSISEIVEICSEKAKTSMYTNGSLPLPAGSDRLALLCISRHHYDDKRNEKIMGISSNICNLAAQTKVPIKLSFVLLNSGINSAREVRAYIDWAVGQGVNSVVGRQLFEPSTSYGYKTIYKNEFVSALKIARALDCESDFTNKSSLEDKIFYEYHGAKIELELRSCACQTDSPVLHSDGRVSSWRDFK